MKSLVIRETRYFMRVCIYVPFVYTEKFCSERPKVGKEGREVWRGKDGRGGMDDDGREAGGGRERR